MSAAMKAFLQDVGPIGLAPDGQILSPFPVEVIDDLCPNCHGILAIVAGLRQCPGCPAINDWLQESRERLQALGNKRADAWLKRSHEMFPDSGRVAA